MLILKWMRLMIALAWLALSTLAAAQTSNTAGGAYNGADGPMTLKDIYWFGPRNSGEMCWYERNFTTGAIIKSHCGQPTPRICTALQKLCDPKALNLCFTADANALLLPVESCVAYDPGTTYQVDVKSLLGATAPQNGDVIAIDYWRCIVGKTCDVNYFEGKIVDITLRTDTTLPKGSPLTLGGANCAHLVNCQRMLTGDINPMGVFSIPTIIHAAQWEKLPGAAVDIGVGANGTVWVLGTAAAGIGGNEIYRLDNGNWTRIPGAAERIAVDSAGNAWVTTKNNEIYRWSGSGWTRLPGAGREIAIDANGRAWVVGTKAVGDGYEVYRWNNSANGWELTPTSNLTRLSVSGKQGDTPTPDGAVGVSGTGRIYLWRERARIWTPEIGQEPGQGALDVAASENGSLFKIGRDGAPYRYSWAGLQWSKLDTWSLPPLVAIATDGSGTPYVLGNNGGIYRYRGKQ